MLTAEEKKRPTNDAPKVVEAGEGETVGVGEVVVPEGTANTSGFITTPEKVDEVETLKAKGWNEDPDIELLKKALRFLASKIGSNVLGDLESAFPTL